jgi:Sensors of blue-light using FAD
MKCFAYLSHAARPETDASLAELVRQCATLNARAGVTGVLAYADGRFAQIVEGPRDGVDEVLARINDSRRHRDITVLGEASIESRAFPDWPMQWVHEADAADLERIGIGMRIGTVRAARPLLPIQLELIGRMVRFLWFEQAQSERVARSRSR